MGKDENGVSIYRKRQDEFEIQIKKLESALDSIETLLTEAKLTDEQSRLALSGLNPQQKAFYNEIVERHEKIEEPTETLPTDEEIEEPDNIIDPSENLQTGGKKSLEAIIYEVCGNTEYKERSVSAYKASKVKVFNKPEKNNLGLSYKLVSIPRKCFGFLNRVFMKIKGDFIKEDTAKLFDGAVERAMNLTDEEVETVLNEYVGTKAISLKASELFHYAVSKRVEKYVTDKLNPINQEISAYYSQIEPYINAIAGIKNKIKNDTSLTEEEIETLQNELDKAGIGLCDSIEKINTLRIEGNKISNGFGGLHSFDETIKAVSSKMNYTGGRFSKKNNYNPELRETDEKLSNILNNRSNYSREEYINAFLKKEELYVSSTLEIRSIRNLGSKVSTGELQYEQYAKPINYQADPFVRDLFTTVLIISSVVNLANEILTNAKNALANNNIEDFNRNIEIYNNEVIVPANQLAEKARNMNVGEALEGTANRDLLSLQTTGENANLAATGFNLGSSVYKALDAKLHVSSGEFSKLFVEKSDALKAALNNGSISQVDYCKGWLELAQEAGPKLTDLADKSKGIFKTRNATTGFDYTAALEGASRVASGANIAETYGGILDTFEAAVKLGEISTVAECAAVVNQISLIPSITLGALAVTSAGLSEKDVHIPNVVPVPKENDLTPKEQKQQPEEPKALLDREDTSSVKEASEDNEHLPEEDEYVTIKKDELDMLRRRLEELENSFEQFSHYQGTIPTPVYDNSDDFTL